MAKNTSSLAVPAQPSRDDIRFMRQALRLAEKGAGWVSPNPMVGAVLVKKGAIIGRGYHQRFGGPHAEIEAIQDCRNKGNDPAGAVLYVTLEPCCHYGKTPPCTGAIIEAGIKKVVIAAVDDTEKVAGKGIQQLTENGIEVVVGYLEEPARRLNAGFFKLNRCGMPQVILKWAQSINGKLNWPAGQHRRWITSEPARRHVHQVRRRCGAILTGIETVLADDPALTVRLRGKQPQPIRVVLDRQLRIPLDSTLLKTAKDAPVLIFTSEKTIQDETHAETLDLIHGCGGEVVGVHEHQGLLDLDQVLKVLGCREVTDLLVEGGVRVHRSFLEAGLADRLMVYVSPVMISDGQGVVSINAMVQPGLWTVVNTRRIGTDVLVEMERS